jgi:mevalonate kinase
MEYPAKILLFGEHGIILNSMALAIPFPRYSGQFRFSATLRDYRSKTEAESNDALKKLLEFLKTNAIKFQFIDLELFEDEINQGLYFDSSIPTGLGNLGALAAAIYERFLIYSQNNKYQTIKSDLAAIETYLNGKSIGFNPLVSLLNKPLLMKGESSIIADVDLSDFFNNYILFLINSDPRKNTDALVNSFMEKYQYQNFKKSIDNEYILIINQTIEAIIRSDFISFEKLISKYSEFQLSHMGEMIPLHMKTHFEHGLESGDFYLKLCGSYSGGLILGIARDRFKAESYFNLNHLDWTVV